MRLTYAYVALLKQTSSWAKLSTQTAVVERKLLVVAAVKQCPWILFRQKKVHLMLLDWMHANYHNIHLANWISFHQNRVQRHHNYLMSLTGMKQVWITL